MSWLRSAVNKAVEVGGKNNLTRTVKSYADTVGQAMAGGAKIFQDRTVSHNFKSFKHAIKRLEEVAVSCRGAERAQLLKRWLIALNELERVSGVIATCPEGMQESLGYEPRKGSLVLFHDPDMGGDPVNFLELFLHSQALEGIILSMILEAPNEEEVSLLLELFRHCLYGGKEVHNAIVSSIQDLAKVFSGYQDEVMVKREELLQFAQAAITGLKIKADIARIDGEASALLRKLGNTESRGPLSSEENKVEEIEDLNETLEKVKLFSRLEALMLKKIRATEGDTPEIHFQKIDKLKVLEESLTSSAMKAEKRISDHRSQKEEALSFRAVKADKIKESEKELAAEISLLEKQRDDLVAQLAKVNASLAAAMASLGNIREEREQLNEASNQLVLHLEMKEDELIKSAASCKVESIMVQTWINFLEDTWVLQSTCAKERDNQANHALEEYGKNFTAFLADRLSAYAEELGTAVNCIKEYVGDFKKLTERQKMEPGTDSEPLKQPLQEKYVQNEAKIIAIFSVVDAMEEYFFAQGVNIPRKDDARIKQLFGLTDEVRREFEAFERLVPDMEYPSSTGHSPELRRNKSIEARQASGISLSRPTESPRAVSVLAHEDMDPTAELAKLESVFGKMSRDYSAEEIGGWEFDELERELAPDHDPKSKQASKASNQ